MTPTYNSSLDEFIYVRDLEVCLPESAFNNNNNSWYISNTYYMSGMVPSAFYVLTY